ncbi:MAG: TetR/AcrR family transcriptional regulator [Halopseudomonas aestusnigri]
MARRVDHSHEQLREMILEAAQNLVEADGYPSLSMRKIGSSIGYSPGTIYNIFANLDDLVLQLNARTLDEMYVSLVKTKSNNSVEVNFDQLLCGYLEFVDTNRNLWRALFDHRPSTESVLPDWYDARIEKLLSLIDDTLKPYFNDEDTTKLRKFSATLWAGLHGIISLTDSNKLDVISDSDPLELCRFLVENFLGGLNSSKCKEG